MNNRESVKAQTFSGAVWKFSERLLTQLVSFVVSVILARILAPDDYGLIALVFVFTTICDKLLICGFATSLIQKKNADSIDFSSVFYFSLGAAVILYLILYITAPYIADFYDKYDRQLLINVIRVFGLSLFLVAFSSVQHAYVSKFMLFKRNFWAALVGIIISGLVGIYLAYCNYGVWALVAQNLLQTIVGALILFIIVPWRPALSFSVERLKGLFTYGWKIFASSIIKVIYNDLRSLVIGKVYTPAELAFYNRGQTLPQLVDTNVAGTIDSVLFPAYSKLQDDKVALLSAMRRAVKTSCYILMPLLALMAAISEPLVSLLLTDKWLPCVPIMQILCFSFMFSPVETENLQSIKAVGRSDIVLKLEIAKRTIGVFILICAIPFGLNAIAVSMLIGNIIAAILNASSNKRLNGYLLKSQLQDVLPSLLTSFAVFAISFVFVCYVSEIIEWIKLIGGIFLGFAIYIGISILFKIESFYYLLDVIKKTFCRKEL